MKVLLVTLLVIASAFARSAAQENVMAEGPECPIADPLLVDGPVPLNATLDPLANIRLGSNLIQIITEGLSTLRYEVDINVILLTLSFEINIPKVDGNATYAAEGYVDFRPLRDETIPSGNFYGSGLGKVGGTNIKVVGSGSLVIPIGGGLHLLRLALSEVSFTSISLDLGPQFIIKDRVIDWAEFNRNIKQNFDQDWALYNDAVTEKIRQAANNYLRHISLQRLIDLLLPGDGKDC